MHRKARDYAPPSFVSRPSSPRLPSFVPRPLARNAANAPVPSSFVPPPKRPYRRQCRSAASRTAGTSHRRWQLTGDPCPPVPTSWARSRKGPEPLPGFRRRWRRKEAGSFFPAACTPGKIPLTERRVKRVRPPGGRTLFAPKRSGESSSQRPKGALARDTLAQMFLGTFERNHFALYTAFIAL